MMARELIYGFEDNYEQGLALTKTKLILYIVLVS